MGPQSVWDPPHPQVPLAFPSALPARLPFISFYSKFSTPGVALQSHPCLPHFNPALPIARSAQTFPPFPHHVLPSSPIPLLPPGCVTYLPPPALCVPYPLQRCPVCSSPTTCAFSPLPCPGAFLFPSPVYTALPPVDFLWGLPGPSTHYPSHYDGSPSHATPLPTPSRHTHNPFTGLYPARSCWDLIWEGCVLILWWWTLLFGWFVAGSLPHA